jgi:hypothetical protein
MKTRNGTIRVRIEESGIKLLYPWASQRGSLGRRWSKGASTRWQFLLWDTEEDLHLD